MDTFTANIEEARSIGVRERLLAFLELTKPRIAFLLVLTSAAGFYMASNGGFDAARFVNAMVAITLLAFGVSTLNQYIERRIDVFMPRTAARPLPTKKITATEALVFGIAQCVIAEVYLLTAVNVLTAFLGLLVIIGYVFLYTPLKTKTSLSTVVGAFPGAMPPLMGWTAATGDITLVAWMLFATQFLWQFPHFLSIAWLYRDQYAKAGILMLPVVEPTGKLTARQIVLFTIMLVPVSLAPFFFHASGLLFLIGATAVGIWFLWSSIQAARTRTDDAARKLLLVSVIYLPVFFLLMVIDKN
ncbi:MAG TPA: heme o synthase [Pyrinomonadaceae bacterium]|nr:heme o synthase [Pyrinomonadaceae bacterium]